MEVEESEESNTKFEEFNSNKMNYNSITLNDCLYLFSLEESLSQGNEWYCKSCKRRCMAHKKIELFYLPKLLCICLKRFTKYRRSYSKNDELVHFPIDDLDLSSFVCGPNKKDSKYELFAVSEHYGDMGFGHYTSICKNIDGYWYKYDDSSCQKTSVKNVCTEAAYVLFFRRK